MTGEEAQRKYLALVHAMDLVQECLDEIRASIKQFRPMDVSWKVRTRREFQALRLTAQARMDDLRETAKKYEAEMVAREWRP